MDATRERFPHKVGDRYAQRVARELWPFCDRLAILGSIRRGAEKVKDAEILCIPTPGPPQGQAALLPETVAANPAVDALTVYLRDACNSDRSPWDYRLDRRGRQSFGPANKFLLFDTFPIDVFSTTPESWGMQTMVRTGPAEWNQHVMSAFRAAGMRGHVDHISRFRDSVWSEIYPATEDEVFDLLGWEYVEPEYRTGERALRLRRGIRSRAT